MSQWGGTSGSAVAVGVEWGAWPKPRPRLVLRGQLHSQRREVLGAVGQPEGTGQDGEGASGQHAGQGSRESCRVEVCVCLSWPPRLNQSGPSRLSHRSADREGIEGARLLGLQHLLPTFLEGWRRCRSASGNGAGGSVLRSMFLQSVLRLHLGPGRCCIGLGQPPAPAPPSCKEPSSLPLCPLPHSGATLQPSARWSPPCLPMVSVHRPISDRRWVLTWRAASPQCRLASRSPAGAAAFIGARSTRAAAHSCGRGSYTLTRCRRQQGI